MNLRMNGGMGGFCGLVGGVEAIFLKGVEVQRTDEAACFSSAEGGGHGHRYEGRDIVVGGSRLQE